MGVGGIRIGLCSTRGPKWTPSLSSLPGHHEWLLGPDVDILPFLLLPLAGPEEFSEEEMDRECPRWES